MEPGQAASLKPKPSTEASLPFVRAPRLPEVGSARLVPRAAVLGPLVMSTSNQFFFVYRQNCLLFSFKNMFGVGFNVLGVSQ